MTDLSPESKLLQITVNEREARLIVGIVFGAAGILQSRELAQEKQTAEAMALTMIAANGVKEAILASGLSVDDMVALGRRFMHLAPTALQDQMDALLKLRDVGEPW